MVVWSDNVLCSWTLIWLFITITRSQHTCQQCNCIISENVRQPKGNINVRTQCREGRIDWPNPYGAVRLELQTKFRGEFRSCLIVTAEYTSVKISQEEDNQLRHLRTVHGTSSEFCIDSLVPVFLYLEPERVTNVRFSALTRVSVDYDIERLHKKLSFDPLEDCRPCDNKELLQSYCSSDYVIEASMVGVQERGDEAEISVHVRRLIQHRQADMLRTRRHAQTHAQTHAATHATITAPSKCGIQRGAGDTSVYMFTGRVKLGRMRLGCVVTMAQWERLKRLAEQNGQLECSHD